jgi:hypothetical protein
MILNIYGQRRKRQRAVRLHFSMTGAPAADTVGEEGLLHQLSMGIEGEFAGLADEF